LSFGYFKRLYLLLFNYLLTFLHSAGSHSRMDLRSELFSMTRCDSLAM